MICLALISDTHCGHVAGLHPPDFVTDEGKLEKQNDLQKWMWDCWLAACDEIIAARPAAIIHVGDAVDGAQFKDRGMFLSLRNHDQATAAAQCFQPLIDATGAKYYQIHGTGYHVGAGGSEEKHLAELLKAEKYVGSGSKGKRASQVLDLDVDGVKINIAHHIGFAPVNPGLPLIREINRAMISEQQGNTAVDCIVRGHVHMHTCLKSKMLTAFTMPCWQMFSDFTVKTGGPFGPVDLGVVLLWVDPEAKRRGRNPITVDERLFRLPSRPVTRVKLK